jgi:fructokinase
LTDGFRNSNFRVRLDSETAVLRVYEHDASLCRKEIDLLGLLAGSVPVPDVIHAEVSGLDELPPFAWIRYVEGITFRELRRRGDLEATAQAATSAGAVLAAVHRTIFPKAGWLGPALTVGAPLLEGDNAMPRFVDLCLDADHVQRRLTASIRERVHDAMWSRAGELAVLGQQPHLVHGDFNMRNTLVRHDGGRWVVSAVLDWEFALSSTPLTDFGNFLRSERGRRPQIEPHFSRAYMDAGGCLPDDWRRLARLVDLVALSASLAEERLPATAEAELIELVRATVAFT